MRNKLLVYLFIFATIIGIFIYVNDKRILDAKEQKIESLRAQLEASEAKNDSLGNTQSSDVYFQLKGNEDAITYFEEQGIEVSDLTQNIENELLSRNSADADNEFVPLAGMNGPMRINKIAVLNHKWLIADFTDGTYWGEVFMTYEVAEDGSISFQRVKSFLYPQY